MCQTERTFLGKPFDYWIELNARIQLTTTYEVNQLLVDALVENAKLKKRVSHLEGEWKRIEETMKSLRGLD